MADVDLNVRVKGRDRAKQDLQSLAGAVDAEAEKISQKERTRKKRDEESEKSGIGHTLSTAVGTAIGNAVPNIFGAFNRSIAQAFDPNLSPVEKELNLANAALDLVPLEGGAIPKAILAAQTQEIVGGARGTGSRINQLLGPAFQASGSLSDEDFEKRFAPIIERLRKIIEPQERSRERGSQLVAENLGSFLDEFKKVSGKPPNNNKETTEATKEQTAATRELTNAMSKLADILGVGGVLPPIPGRTD